MVYAKDSAQTPEPKVSGSNPLGDICVSRRHHLTSVANFSRCNAFRRRRFFNRQSLSTVRFCHTMPLRAEFGLWRTPKTLLGTGQPFNRLPLFFQFGMAVDVHREPDIRVPSQRLSRHSASVSKISA